MGGTLLPKAFPAAMMVTLEDLVDVMFCGLVFVENTILVDCVLSKFLTHQHCKCSGACLSNYDWLILSQALYSICPEYLLMQTLPLQL